MFDYEKVIPAPIPMKRAPVKTHRDPYHCLPMIYTDNLYKEQQKGSLAFRAKVAADRERLGL